MKISALVSEIEGSAHQTWLTRLETDTVISCIGVAVLHSSRQGWNHPFLVQRVFTYLYGDIVAVDRIPTIGISQITRICLKPVQFGQHQIIATTGTSPCPKPSGSLTW